MVKKALVLRWFATILTSTMKQSLFTFTWEVLKWIKKKMGITFEIAISYFA